VVDVDLDVSVDVVLDGDVYVDIGAPRVDGGPGLRNRDMSPADTSDMLSFQRLDVYQRAIELLALVTEIVEDVPRGHAERSDQLIRAAESVVRNIAEGAGRWSEADSSKHYKIARGEAMEAAASLDVMKLRQLVTPQRYQRGIQLLESVVAMLTKMV
jgi:four helix bundle protein